MTNNLPKNIYVLVAILFVYSWFLSFFSIRMMLKVSYVLTKDGKDIYVRLNGLKHYLDDFGRFDEKGLREIVLWEDYILYAIILGESDKLENELMNKNFI